MKPKHIMIGMISLIGILAFSWKSIWAVDSNDIWDECTGTECGAPPSGGIGGGGGGGGPVIIAYELGPYFYLQDDEDHDGAHDIYDNCVLTPNLQSENSDGDSWGDACDNCPQTANNDQVDTDIDGLGDACDPDDDNDSIPDDGQGGLGPDNCQFATNASQIDTDGDGMGDACDDDDDNDGIPDDRDNCDLVYNPGQANTDEYTPDDYGDDCDNDLDNDGYPDYYVAGGWPVDLCPRVHCESNDDSDDDGVGDACDNCPSVSNSDQADEDQDGRGDVCDA